MTKTILSMLAAALVCAAATSARADGGISASTLNEMGLGGLQVMSDSDAMAVRGMGFFGSKAVWKAKMSKPRRDKQPWSKVFGNSFATVNSEHDGGAHSENGYIAEGPYAASGENFSEASKTIVDTETVIIDGSIKTVTNTWSIHVQAGGFSSAMSF